MAKLQKIVEELKKYNFAERIEGFHYDAINSDRVQGNKEWSAKFQDNYVVVHGAPIGSDEDHDIKKIEIERFLLSEDVIPKGILVLGDVSGESLSDEDKTRIEAWVQNPDNVSIPDETIKAPVPIYQDTSNCSIVSMMLLLLNNDKLVITEKQLRASNGIDVEFPLGSVEACSKLNWTPETNVVLTSLGSWIKMITAIGYTTRTRSLDKDRASEWNEDVVIGLGGEDNPPVTIGKGYRLIGINAFAPPEENYIGHVIPIISVANKWYVMSSNLYDTDRDEEMYPLPKFLTEDGTRLLGTNYTLKFNTRNAQSVVQINESEAPSTKAPSVYNIYPGRAKGNFYVYARTTPIVLGRVTKRSDVIHYISRKWDRPLFPIMHVWSIDRLAPPSTGC